MSASVRRIGMAAVAAAGMALWVSGADAFFPIGGFDSLGVLRYAKWPLSEFDTNNDGEVSAGEGLEILIEGGKSGFTNDEIAIVREAFQVWQDVPSSYVSFRTAGVVQDPLLSGLQPDFRSVVSLQLTAADDTGEDVVPDPAAVIITEVAFPVLGLTSTFYTVDDEILVVAGQSYQVSAGTLLDVDIHINGTAVRPGLVGMEPAYELKGVLVHEIGHLLGLDHTPLNNVRAERTSPDTDYVELVENEVFWLTGVDGIGRFIGATPTMFPVYFSVQRTGQQRRYAGTSDLAPDDISGISYLYPRGSQSNYFTIQHEARSHTRAGTGLPSVPLPGGHIVAWADVDNDPSTARIPLFSTMAGLYRKTSYPQLEGWFDLIGLWKQIEVPATAGTLFNPSYSLSLSPINGVDFDRQAPEGYIVESFDSIQAPGGLSVIQRSSSTYVTAFPSEVFHEVANVVDVSQKDAGTPVVWSFEANTPISQDTGRTLAQILPNNRPMFGDPNDVCPLNVIDSGGTSTTTTATIGSQTLRSFRDTVLLRSAVGMALVDAYYRAAPMVARFLIRHVWAFDLFRACAHFAYWVMSNAMTIFGGIGAAGVAAWGWRRYRRVRSLAAGLILAVVLGYALSAGADIAFVTTPQMAAAADHIVIGKVVSAESRWGRAGRIYTDVVLEVEESAKGNANKASYLSFSVLGGRVGGVIMRVSEMPIFKADEEVLLYLREGYSSELIVYGGVRGKQTIVNDGGKKYVIADREDTKLAMALDAKAMAEKNGEDGSSEDKAQENGRIPVDKYLAYLRSLVRDQKRQTP